MNFIAQSMRRFGLAPDNKVKPSNVPGTRAAASRSPIAHMMIGSKWSKTTLQYPLDIQGRSDQGHYMMFYINEPVNAAPIVNKVKPKTTRQGNADLLGAHEALQGKMKSSVGGIAAASASLKNAAQMAANAALGVSEKASTEATASSYNANTNTWMPGGEPRTIKREAWQGTTSTLLNVVRTKRTSDSIVLYMPNQLTVNYAAAYKEEEIGSTLANIAAKGMDAFQTSVSDALLSGGGEGLKDAFKLGAETLKDKGAQMLGAAGVGNPMAMKNKLENQAMNNYLEVMFTGIAHRKFSYNWKFTPKNAEESAEVDNIIRKFKFHMLPEKPSDTEFGRYWITPSEFDLFYMFRGEENTWFNKVSTCVLVNMDINWTPQQYQTFRPVEGKNGAPPVEVDLKLDFMETRLITKAEAVEGY